MPVSPASRSLIRVCIPLSLAAVIAACSPSKGEPPIELLPGLMSQAEVVRTKRDLKIDDSRWLVVEDDRLPAGDKRPPYHYLVALVKGFATCLDANDGALAFFNDRLLSVTCYPHDFDKFIAALAERSIVDFGKGENKTRTGARAIFGTDSTGRRFVTIEDPFIREELGRWIRKYS